MNLKFKKILIAYDQTLNKYQICCDDNIKKSIFNEFAHKFYFTSFIFYRRLNDIIKFKKKIHIASQIFISKIEKSLMKWILKMQNWNWLSKIRQIRLMIMQMFDRQRRIKCNILKKKWIDKFLNRHEKLNIAFINVIDKKRILMYHSNRINVWFDFFDKQFQKYDFCKKKHLQHEWKKFRYKCNEFR